MAKQANENVSATKSIEAKIAELQALKDVVQFIENEIENNTNWKKEYEEQIANVEAEGEKLPEHDYRREYIKEYISRISGLRSILLKLVD